MNIKSIYMETFQNVHEIQEREIQEYFISPRL